MTYNLSNINKVLINHSLVRAFFMVALLALSLPVAAQVTPADTTKVKPRLETGPPDIENPEYQPPVIVQPAPKKVVEPEPKKVKKVKIKEEPDYRKYFINGNLELYFGNVTYLNLAPALGYRLTRNLAIGPGVKYEYINYYGQQYHNYGAKLFTQYLFKEYVFAHAEMELLNVKDSEYVGNVWVRDFRRTITTLLIGAGYRQNISDRASADMLLLFNLNDNIYSPYHNPIIRVGFNIDLGR